MVDAAIEDGDKGEETSVEEEKSDEEEISDREDDVTVADVPKSKNDKELDVDDDKEVESLLESVKLERLALVETDEGENEEDAELLMLLDDSDEDVPGIGLLIPLPMVVPEGLPSDSGIKVVAARPGKVWLPPNVLEVLETVRGKLPLELEPGLRSRIS